MKPARLQRTVTVRLPIAEAVDYVRILPSSVDEAIRLGYQWEEEDPTTVSADEQIRCGTALFKHPNGDAIEIPFKARYQFGRPRWRKPR